MSFGCECSQLDIMSLSMGMSEYGRCSDDDEEEYDDEKEEKVGGDEGVFITSWPGGA